MIRSLESMPSLVRRLIQDVETELVEYKRARNSFRFDDLGRYFSALSNEANLRHAECGWLIFGVSDDRKIVGTAYRKEKTMPSVGLRQLKQEISEHVNGGMTFEEIYEFEMDGKRIVVFQIPPGTFATPTTWKGVPWSRDNSAIVEMPKFKLEHIYSQSRPDWSREIAYEASYDDLDPEAVAFAQEQFLQIYGDRQPGLLDLNGYNALQKMRLIIHGHITKAAIVLLGKPEASVFLGGAEPEITWSQILSNGSTNAYEHFNPPFILQVDRVLSKIRNERFRLFNKEDTLFPSEMQHYDPEIIRELLHNAIAHQDFRLSGKINVLEYEDHLVFLNEGDFIPGTIETALESGYRPPYYRNDLLASAMTRTGMMDRNAMGIRSVFSIQRSRLLPMPTYDLSTPARVSVTLYGTAINSNYATILAQRPELPLEIVMLLDFVQKRIPISKEQAALLRRYDLIKGRYPNLTISTFTNGSNGDQAAIQQTTILDNKKLKNLILEHLRAHPSTRAEIVTALDDALPKAMSDANKTARIGYLLQQLRKAGRIYTVGHTSVAVWHVSE